MNVQYPQQPVRWGAFLPQVTVALRGASPATVRRPMLGAPTSPEEWYSRAVRNIAKYDALVDRAEVIANKVVREQILETYHSDPADKDGAWYARDAVAYNVGQVESYPPLNYLIFNAGQAQNRVDRLSSWNKDLESSVANAEATYGSIPASTIIREVVASPATVPLLVGAGVVALALLLS